MAADTLSIADRLERSGAPSSLARTIAVEFAEAHEARRLEQEAARSELVTREHLDLALGKLKAEVERDIGMLRLGTERLLREQTN